MIANSHISKDVIEVVDGGPSVVEEAHAGLIHVLEMNLLQLLWCPDGTDSDRLRIVVDSLMGTLKARHIAGDL